MKYKNAFDSNNAPFDPNIVAKVNRVFEYAISELRIKFGAFDKRGEEKTLQRCKEHAAIALVGCSLEWRNDEGLISMLPRAEMKLAEALEELPYHREPKSWPKGMGAKHNFRYNPCDWFRAKCVAVFWQLEVGVLKRLSEQREPIKMLIEKHGHLFPEELAGKEEHIFQQCEAYSRWWKELQSRPISFEGMKAEIRDELYKLEAETAMQEARAEVKKPEPSNEELFQWVSFNNAVLEDFLLALLPEGREEMKREIDAKKERRKLAHRLAKEVLKEHPETEVFGDEESVHWVHFPILEEAFRDFTRLRKDAYSEAAFREKLRVKLAALEADKVEKLRLYNPEDAQPFRGAIGLPKDWHKEQQKERKDYLMALFRNTLLAEYLTALFPEAGQPEAGQALPEDLTFDSLFVHPSGKEELLAALRELALIDGKGGLIAGKGKAPLRAAWDAAIQQGFLNETSLEAFQVFYSHFRATVSKSTFYEVPPKRHYPDLYKELLARLNRKN